MPVGVYKTSPKHLNKYKVQKYITDKTIPPKGLRFRKVLSKSANCTACLLMLYLVISFIARSRFQPTHGTFQDILKRFRDNHNKQYCQSLESLVSN